MVDIFPFRGTRYTLEKLAQDGYSISDVVTPPYDVIDAAQQQTFMKKHPANFVHVDLNPKTATDTEQNNPYTRAASFIHQWEKEQTLMSEKTPAIYAYSQSWLENGTKIVRKGAVALLRLENFESGQVLPHEHTLKGPKQDRLQLMRSTLCNLSQIFMIYSDPTQTLEKLLYKDTAKSFDWVSVSDQDAVEHCFAPVTDNSIVTSLQQLFQDKPLLIADGHHRYETALAYQKEVRSQIQEKTGTEPPAGSLLSDYCMIFLTNMDDPGLKVYPTHRILYQWPEGWSAERFEKALMEKFSSVPSSDNATFSYRKDNTHELIHLQVKPESHPSHLPELLDTFDAAILEEVIFKGIFNTTGEALKHKQELGFYRSEADIDTLWKSRKAVAGFYLAAPSVKLVHQICKTGNRMPQKSTYFYPKILSGLVTYLYRNFAETTQNALSGQVTAEPVPSTSQQTVSTL